MTELPDQIAVLRVSSIRRGIAFAVQAALGVVLIAVALRLPDPAPLAVGALVILGALILWQAVRTFRATGRDVILTRAGLFDSSGERIAAIDDIAAVDRSAFAFKPSNGFALRLAAPAPRRWVPGVWWRIGTHVGVGGATSGKAAGDMADIIKLLKEDPRAGIFDPD